MLCTIKSSFKHLQGEEGLKGNIKLERKQVQRAAVKPLFLRFFSRAKAELELPCSMGWGLSAQGVPAVL